jgi:hypothetical protein
MKHAREDYNRIQDPENIIPADEPVFLLRGKDICAPTAIQAWADDAERHGAAKNIVDAARNHAEVMKQWQADHECQIPDMP